jgi:hypothetical protein
MVLQGHSGPQAQTNRSSPTFTSEFALSWAYPRAAILRINSRINPIPILFFIAFFLLKFFLLQDNIRSFYCFKSDLVTRGGAELFRLVTISPGNGKTG